jgi:hypothetical protein
MYFRHCAILSPSIWMVYGWQSNRCKGPRASHAATVWPRRFVSRPGFAIHRDLDAAA